MTEEQNGVLRDLRAELGAIEPSSGFVAAVKMRVAAESRSRRAAGSWVMALGFAAAASLVIGAVVVWQRASFVEPPRESLIAAVPAPPAVAPVASPAAPDAAPAVPQVSVPRSAPRRSGAAPVTMTAAAAPAEPRLEVITNQGDVLRAVWARVRGPVAEDDRKVTGTPAPDAGAEITVTPLSVDPIVVRVLDPSAPGGGGAPVIRRVAADGTRSER